MKEGCFGDLFDVLVKAKVEVLDDCIVPAAGGRGQGGAVDGELEDFG